MNTIIAVSCVRVLMFRSLDHLALALLFNEGKVAAMWAGLRVLMQADEICA